MRTYISAAAPFLWARVSRQGKVKQQGEVQSLAELPSKLRSDEIYAVVPGEFLVTNEVSIPSRNRNKVKQALPFALEEKLSEEIESFHFLILNCSCQRLSCLRDKTAAITFSPGFQLSIKK